MGGGGRGVVTTIYTRRGVGKPTRLAPIPKPAPVLAETARLGT